MRRHEPRGAYVKNYSGYGAIATGSRPRSARQSNLELMRIVLMLVIIAHHYVVNSGVMGVLVPGTPNAIFLQLWSAWGKAAINAFVLITGYFMCTSRLTWIKVLKLWLEIKFYRIAIFAIMVALGYEALTFSSVTRVLFNLALAVNAGFTASFMVFYLLIPLLNRVLDGINRLQLDRLLAMLLGIYVLAVTFLKSTAFTEVGWYAVLYLLAARFRLFPSAWTESARLGRCLLIASVAAGWLSMLALQAVGAANSRYFIEDSSKIVAFAAGVSCFLFFKNIRIPHSRVINTLASAAFGVLCIHASSDAMRHVLWNVLLDVPAAYGLPFPLLVLHAIGSAFGIYLVCAAIDLVRQAVLERPLFATLAAHREAIEAWGSGVERRFRAAASRVLGRLC